MGYASLVHAVSNSNKEVWESDDIVKMYSRHYHLQKPEKTVLDNFRSKLARMEMLDIGVGGGRTTHFFARYAKEYVGIDYSRKMVESCKRAFPTLCFEVCDARSMTLFNDHHFAFVLFSYNGIDYMDHEDRLRALQEIARVLKSNGYFCFSAHNLYAIPSLFVAHSTMNPIRLFHEKRKIARLERLNKEILESEDRDSVIFNDGAHGFRLQTYYIKPEKQVRQLNDAGFINVKLYRLSDGQEIKFPFTFESTTDPWLYYLCTKA